MLTANEYYETVVCPTIYEFYNNKWDRRRAMLACIVTLHIIDHVVQNRMSITTGAEARRADKEVERIVKELTSRNDHFRTVRAYATAAKHGQIGLQRGFEPGFDSGRGKPIAPKRWYPTGFDGAGNDVGGVTIEWDNSEKDSLVVALVRVSGLLEVEFPELKQPA